MLPNMAFLLFSLTVIVFISLSLSDVNTNIGLYPSLQHLNLSRTGICILVVPTVNLISPQSRASTARPQGYGTRFGFSKIEVCCTGYTPKSGTLFQCEPLCDDGCPNGNCTAPNVCSCKPNYIKGRHGNCIPTCPIGCANGVCINYGVCYCNAGFQLNPDGKSCSPVCTGGCGPGGECIGAEACHCASGHSLNRNTNKCQYYCKGGCKNGNCIGPNKCSCKSGYKLVKKACTPQCPRGCKNGKCIRPGVCSCKAGWTLDRTSTVCKPHCHDPCLNADCTAPHTCTCKRGYIKDPRNPQGNRCFAHCPGGCENGTCSAPNFCICNSGFVKEGSNRCVPKSKTSILLDSVFTKFKNL